MDVWGSISHYPLKGCIKKGEAGRQMGSVELDSLTETEAWSLNSLPLTTDCLHMNRGPGQAGSVLSLSILTVRARVLVDLRLLLPASTFPLAPRGRPWLRDRGV